MRAVVAQEKVERQRATVAEQQQVGHERRVAAVAVVADATCRHRQRAQLVNATQQRLHIASQRHSRARFLVVKKLI